jgi:diguanylate cyclase (GGDEF)-like protein
VLCLDLDHFKDVNDTLGHPVGDKLLSTVSEQLSRIIGRSDTVARLGGDEFAIIQRNAAAAENIAMASAIIDLLHAPFEVDGHQVLVGVSIGIAVAPADGKDPDALLKAADMALYRAKTDGRGGYQFFEPEMDARMQAGGRWSSICARHCRTASWKFITSRLSTSTGTASAASRRCCAGTIPSAA